MSSSQTPGATLGKRGIRIADLHWSVVIGIAAMHLGCILAPFYFTWTALVVFFVFAWLTGGIGITLCYHRLLTHRSFTTPKWFEYLITCIGCLAWQGGPIQWVGTHRIHHAHSDEEEDPHTPKHGFTWAHALWCMHNEDPNRPPKDAAKDLLRDPVLRNIDKYFFIPQFLLLPLLYIAGELVAKTGVSASGISWLVWGVFVRTVVVYHGTWFVNSAAHTWGYRNFKTSDNSTNVWWVALLSFGEGWHNNHHAFQRSAAHGLRWWEFDLTYVTIRLLGLVGLARDIVYPTKEQIIKKKSRDNAASPASNPLIPPVMPTE